MAGAATVRRHGRGDRHRRRNHRCARPGGRRVGPRHHVGLPGVPPVLPHARLGRARRRRDLGRGRPERCRGRRDVGRAGDADRRHRDHQPAGDDGGVGPSHRSTAVPGHRLAGPPDRRPLRATGGRWTSRPGPPPDGPRSRPLLLGDQAGVALGQRGRRSIRRPGLRYGRQLDHLAAHGWSGPRHRRVERQPDHVVRHRAPAMERRTTRPLRHSGHLPARGRSVERPPGCHGGRRHRGPAGRHCRVGSGR